MLFYACLKLRQSVNHVVASIFEFLAQMSNTKITPQKLPDSVECYDCLGSDRMECSVISLKK